MIRFPHPPRRSARGFTLAELAIAFLVISLLLGGMLVTLSAQNQARQIGETQRTMENARDALLGFCGSVRPLSLPAIGGCPLGGEEARRADAIKTCEVCAVADRTGGHAAGDHTRHRPDRSSGRSRRCLGNRVRYAVTNWARHRPPTVANCPTDFERCPASTYANTIASLGMTTGRVQRRRC